MDAGTSGVRGPSTDARTASAFRWSGTEQMSVSAARIRRTDIDMACVGTSASV
jgi:hypothetical protein